MEDTGLVFKKQTLKIARASSKPPGSYTYTTILLSINPHGYLLWLGQLLEAGGKDARNKSGPCNPVPTDDLPLCKTHLSQTKAARMFPLLSVLGTMEAGESMRLMC